MSGGKLEKGKSGARITQTTTESNKAPFHSRLRKDVLIEGPGNELKGALIEKIKERILKLQKTGQGRKTLERAADMLANALKCEHKESEINLDHLAQMLMNAINCVTSDFDKLLSLPEGTFMDNLGMQLAENADILLNKMVWWVAGKYDFENSPHATAFRHWFDVASGIRGTDKARVAATICNEICQELLKTEEGKLQLAEFGMKVSEETRKMLADLLGCQPRNIFF